MIPSTFRGWKDWNAGDAMMAEFVSTKWEDFRGKPTPNHLVKVIECNFSVRNKEGDEIELEGKHFTINSAGTLNKLLEDAQPGQVLQFTYQGKHRSTDPKDTQEYHTFEDVALGDLDDGTQPSEEDDLGL